MTPERNRQLLLMLMALVISVFARAQEFRVGVSAETGIVNRLSGELEIEARKVFSPEPYFSSVFQGKIKYAVNRRLDVAASYSYTYKKNQFTDYTLAGDESSDRDKVTADLVYQPKRFSNNVRLTNRFRYQYAVTDDKKPKEYFRNRMMLDYRLNQKMNPYVAIEPYFHLRNTRINIIRFYLGNEVPVWKTEMELFYIAEVHIKKGNSFAQYMIGATFKI
jgi:hypothetical protein